MSLQKAPMPTPSNQHLETARNYDLYGPRKQLSILQLQESPEKLQKTQEFSYTDKECKDTLSTEQSPQKLMVTKRKAYAIPFQPIEVLKEETKSQGITTINTQEEKKEIRVTIQERKSEICSQCKQPENQKKMIRSCKCKGNLQFCHQKCMQQTLIDDYMDATKSYFVKRLQCEICSFNYVIKTYKFYHLSNLWGSGENKRKFFGLLFGLILLILILGGLLSIVAIYREVMIKKIDILTLICLILFFCFSLIIVVIYHIGELSISFDWKVLDITQNRNDDNGVIVQDQEFLNIILKKAKNATTRISPNKQ